MTFLLQQSPNAHTAHIILGHGAGAPMDSAWMDGIAGQLNERAIAVTRFEFAYMAERRETGKKRPAPRAEMLCDEYRAVIDTITADLRSRVPLFIGGKSMGGRVASMIADDQFDLGVVAGLVCLGYPFHPPKKPDKLRTAHLSDLRCPALIIQGERDPLGKREEVAAYDLSPAIKLHWSPDGDHDLKPRKSTGLTLDDNLSAAVDAIAKFAKIIG